MLLLIVGAAINATDRGPYCAAVMYLRRLNQPLLGHFLDLIISTVTHNGTPFRRRFRSRRIRIAPRVLLLVSIMLVPDQSKELRRESHLFRTSTAWEFGLRRRRRSNNPTGCYGKGSGQTVSDRALAS